MRNLELAIHGSIYSGWTDLSVTRSMEALADEFSVSVAEAWSPSSRPSPIASGDPVEVRCARELVLSGWIDADGVDYDAETHSLTLEGRAKTGDLVDCAAEHASGEWHNAGLLQIASDLCRPFGLTAQAAAGLDLGATFAKFTLQDGETVHEALERACRQRGVLMMTTPAGQLLLTRAGNARTKTAIEHGVNILRCQRRRDFRDRYSTYKVKTQTPGSDSWSGTSAAQPLAQALDSGVERHRPHIVHAETADVAALSQRATWECSTRAGRSQRITYSVEGWENAEGLWAPNTLVRVRDSWAHLDDELLLVSVRLHGSDQGQLAELELAGRTAMTVEPYTPPASGGGW